jgi:hypothetical protein
VQAAEDDWRGEDQIAFGGAVFTRSRALGLPQVFQYALAGRNVGPPRIGERDAPARPVEKPSLEVRLEVRNPAADRRERRAEAAGRRRKTAGFDHRQQDEHRFKTVHRTF